jgi:hypothetical protein
MVDLDCCCRFEIASLPTSLQHHCHCLTLSSRDYIYIYTAAMKTYASFALLSAGVAAFQAPAAVRMPMALKSSGPPDADVVRRVKIETRVDGRICCISLVGAELNHFLISFVLSMLIRTARFTETALHEPSAVVPATRTRNPALRS